MVNPEHQPPVRIMPLYQGVIRQIMADHDIEPLANPDHVVRADADFAEVVRHTHWYVDRGDTQPHYRYRRYSEVLGRLKPANRRMAHIDIGCGAGLFSWVFLDWARENGLTYDRVDLYGLDHNPEMINLAQEVKARLTHHIADYPALRYVRNVDDLLRELAEYHQVDTDYIVTFGHVLVQTAGNSKSTEDFARILAHVRGMLNTQCNCTAIAVDAQGQSLVFTVVWQVLLNRMALSGINHQPISVPSTHINDNSRAKIARIYPIR